MKSKENHSILKPEEVELPFYDLYKAIKQLDEETGHATVDIQSYLRLLEKLQDGYMLLSKESLFLLCEKLWMKPYHRQSVILNKQVLQQLLDETFLKLAAETPDPAQAKQNLPKIKSQIKKRGSQINPYIPPPQSKPQPSETDQVISRQQGTLSIYVSEEAASEETVTASAGDVNSRFVNKSFLVKGSYLPVNPRRIEQSVRLYRQRLKGMHKWDLDWPGTIQEISKKGYFDGFVLRETDVFSSHFTVLVDHSASMAAFKAYSEEIAAAVAKDNINDYEEIFYFNNYPDDRLYFDRLQTDSVPLNRFASESKKNILLISDAGAARGSFNRERIKATLRGLRKLKKHRIAWINPMPRIRWRNTSAEMIAEFVDMFDIGEGSIDELSNIVRLFKSKITTGKI